MASYIGYIIAFFAMCSYASLAPIAKKLTNEGLTGFYLILINSAFLGIFAIIALLFSNQNFEVFKKIPLSTWSWIALWALINFVGFALYIWAVARIPVVNYQIMYLASPLIGALIAFVLLSEPLQVKHLIGGLFVAIGIFITIK